MSLIILCEGRGEGGDTFIGLKIQYLSLNSFTTE